MFQLPDLTQETIRLVGIDPGTDNLGLAVLTIDPKTYEIIETTAATYRGGRLEHYDVRVSAIQGDRLARLLAHRCNLVERFAEIKPTMVASEAPFYNRLRPNAYGPLVESLWVIKEAVWSYDGTMALREIDPPTVKKGVMAKELKGKEPMKDALKALHQELRLSEAQIDAMDEHSVDAVAVAYTLYMQECFPERFVRAVKKMKSKKRVRK